MCFYALLACRVLLNINPAFQVKYLKDYAAMFKLKIQFNTYIKKISRNENKEYILKDKNGTAYTCKTLIMR